MQCVKLGGETSENFHDVHKVCLSLCLSVFMCFVKIYVFLLIKNDLG